MRWLHDVTRSLATSMRWTWCAAEPYMTNGGNEWRLPASPGAVYIRPACAMRMTCGAPAATVYLSICGPGKPGGYSIRAPLNMRTASLPPRSHGIPVNRAARGQMVDCFRRIAGGAVFSPVLAHGYCAGKNAWDEFRRASRVSSAQSPYFLSLTLFDLRIAQRICARY